VDIASAAARREESMSNAVAAIEKKRAAINKNNLAKSNPIADAVVEAAKERGEDILEAVAELQERKAAQEKRDSVLKARSHRLAFMLERTGLISHRGDLSSRATTARSDHRASARSYTSDRSELLVSPRAGATGREAAPARRAEPSSEWKRTAYNAVRHGDEKTLKAMLDEAPQYMDCRGAHGVTMLHVAARFGHVPIVETLLLRGADVCAKDDKGKTPYDKAQAAGFEEVAAMLVPPVPRSAAAQRSPTIEFNMQPSRPLETLEC